MKSKGKEHDKWEYKIRNVDLRKRSEAKGNLKDPKQVKWKPVDNEVSYQFNDHQWKEGDKEKYKKECRSMIITTKKERSRPTITCDLPKQKKKSIKDLPC